MSIAPTSSPTKNAEKNLADSEEIFHLLVDSVTDYAIFALDTTGTVLTWNSGARRLKGYQPSEIIGSNFSRFYTAEDIARNHPQYELKQALLTGRYEEEGWRLRKDGSRFWANVTITVLRDREGEHRGFAKVTRDLSARKQAEEALRSSEERFRLLIEAVSDYAIFMLDPKGYVVSWNEGARRNNGYEALEIIGQHFSKFYMPEDLAKGKPENDLKVAKETGRFEDFGWRIRKDGSKFWANVILTAIRGKEGAHLGFSKVTRDLTERKAAEDELQKAYENLERRVEERTADLAKAKEVAERAAQMRDDFLSIASHELKTPLTSLKLQTQMRKRNLIRGNLTSFAPANLNKMVNDDDRQLDRIIRLVDDMLDISRLTLGRPNLELENLNLSELVGEVLDRFASQLEAANTPASVDFSSKNFGRWDRYRLEQVVANLLTNAMKYGSGKPIYISVSDEGENAKLEVRDQGIGIAQKDQARVFEQFERAVSANEISGLGLGLFICRQIIELQGGTISVESEINKGSTFTVLLPLRIKI